MTDKGKNMDEVAKGTVTQEMNSVFDSVIYFVNGEIGLCQEEIMKSEIVARPMIRLTTLMQIKRMMEMGKEAIRE